MRSFVRTPYEKTSQRPSELTTHTPPQTTINTSTPSCTAIKSTTTRDHMASPRIAASTSPSKCTSTGSSSSSPPENYFKFTDKHHLYLIKQARRQASALVIDALYDPSKWQFVRELKATSALSENMVMRSSGDEYSPSFDGRKYITPAQHELEVFELRPSAIDRVACVAPRLASDPQQLALRSHTLLARTRVRCKLDEFMSWMTTRRRSVYQGMMNSLHEGHLQHCDVFSGFDTPTPQHEGELDQYVLKYFIVEPTTPTSTRHTTSEAVASEHTLSKGGAISAARRKLNFLRRKSSSDSQDPTEMQQEQVSTQQRTSGSSSNAAAGRIHFCVGEYSTIRPGVMRPDSADVNIRDQRIGIISHHSVEDPELLALCNSVARKTTPRDVRHSTSRTLMQYSGIIAYPVASEDDDDEDFLEVVIKVSCFDARGLSAQKRATMFDFISAFRNLSHMMLVMRLRASPFLTTTNWIANERRKCCLICQQRFSSLRRRHHCRLCGEVTCSKCSAVHQVRLVKEAKVSLRICLLCVQGVDRPKRIEHSIDLDPTEQDQCVLHQETTTISTTKEPRQMILTEKDVPHDQAIQEIEEETARETEALHLVDLGFDDELAKAQSTIPTSSTSPGDPLQHSLGLTVSSSSESESTLGSTIRDFHDSSFEMPLKTAPQSYGKTKGGLVGDDLISLDEASVNFAFDDLNMDAGFDLDQGGHESRSVSPASSSVQPLHMHEEVELLYEDVEPSIRRISKLNEDEEEDEDDARLQALAGYGLLASDNGVMPEDFTLQSLVADAAQSVNCAIAAIGFVDASRDMVSAAYSASPLCQVPRGVLPKQYSLTWDVMQRCYVAKHNQEATATISSTHVVVLDTLKDKTLKRNHFVHDTPFVRFLVGIPLRAWNGVVIGALMVADIQPRKEVTSDELLQLKAHAALVEDWLKNKREEIASGPTSGRGHAEKLHDRLADMLNTTYKTNLEVQMRGFQMQQQGATTQPATTTTKSIKKSKSSTVLHVLY